MRYKLSLILITIIPYLAFAQYKVDISKQNTFKYRSCILINVLPDDSHARISSIFLINSRRIITTDSSIKFWRLPGELRVDSIVIATRLKHVAKSVGMTESDYFEGYLVFGNGLSEIYKMDDIPDDLFKYKWIKPSDFMRPKNSALIYYAEGYAATMGTDTMQYNFLARVKRSLGPFIDSFEKKYHVKIGDKYGVSWGHEGDVSYYFTLSGLSMQQKIRFIYERTKMLNADYLKNPPKTLSVFFPFWISLDQLKQF